MAATFEGKSRAEFFGAAAQRQKRSNAYAEYKPEAPKPVAKPAPAPDRAIDPMLTEKRGFDAGERKTGQIPEVKGSSPKPMEKKETPKPGPMPEAPKNERQKMLERFAQENEAASKKSQAFIAEARKKADAANKRQQGKAIELQAAKKAVEATKSPARKVADTAFGGIESAVKATAQASTWYQDKKAAARNKVRKAGRYFFKGDEDAKREAEKRLQAAKS